MILAATLVWIDSFREDLSELGERLRRVEVVMHPFVLSELACGNFTRREEPLELLQQLRSVTVAEHDEVMTCNARKNSPGEASVIRTFTYSPPQR